MNILSLDIGEKRIGMAITHSAIIANEFDTIENNNLQSVVDKISDIILNEQIDKIVVGLPRNMDGTNGHASQKITLFVERIKEWSSRSLESSIAAPVIFSGRLYYEILQ